MKGIEAVAGDVLAWVVFVGIGVLGLASCAVASVRTYRFLRRRGTAGMALSLASLVALSSFLGLWIVADLCWLARRMMRAARKSLVSPATAADR